MIKFLNWKETKIWYVGIAIAVLIGLVVGLFLPINPVVAASGVVSIDLSSSDLIIKSPQPDKPNQSFAFTPPTLSFNSGFESNSAVAGVEWTAAGGTPTVAISPVHTGTYSLNINANSESVSNSITMTQCSFWFYINTDGNATTIIGKNAVGTPNTITLQDDRTLVMVDQIGIIVITGTTVIPVQTWVRISFGTNNSNSLKLYLNGVQEGSTYTTAYAGISGIFGVYAIVSNDFYYDDIAYTTTASSNDLGDIRTVLAVPNATGDVANFDTTAGSATHWQNVDEAPASLSDADYNEQAGSTQVYDHYNIQDSSTLSISNIVAVNVLARMKTSASSSAAGISVRQATTNYNTLVSNTTSITWFSKYYAAQPATGAWTDSAFDSFQVGAISTGSTRDTFLYAEWVMVAYAVVPGNPASLASPAQTSTSIDLTWTKGTQADQTLIRYRSDGTYPTSVTDGTLGYSNGGSSTTLGSLSASTTYKIRAWAYSSSLGLYSTGTSDLTQATPAGYDISNDPSSKAFSIVTASTTYYAKGSAPSNPVVDGDCTFTVTNAGATAIDIDVKGAAFTGGVGWTLTSGAPGSNTVRITVYKTGDNPASGIVLTTSDQEFVSNLASSGTKKWDFKFETGTFTDGVGKSGIITLTARAVS